MASSQPQGITNHSWTVPAHYLLCSTCRDYRARQSEEAEDDARRIASLHAFHVNPNAPRSRVISISPRLQTSRVRTRTQQELLFSGAGLSRAPRRVTIQLPNLRSPVRPDQSPGFPGRSPRKRPSAFSDSPELPQYFVPAQPGPSHIRVPATPQEPFQGFAPARPVPARPAPVQPFIPGRPNTQTAGDFWSLNSQRNEANAQARAEASIQASAPADFWSWNSQLIEANAQARAEASIQASAPAEAPTTNPQTNNTGLSMPGSWPSWADETNGVSEPNVIPAANAPLLHIQRDEPANRPVNPRVNAPVAAPANPPFGHRLFSFFGGLSAAVFGTLRAAVWRPIQVVQPDQGAIVGQQGPQARPEQPTELQTSDQPLNISATTAQIGQQASHNNGSRAPKRPRLGQGPGQQGPFPLTGSSRSSATSFQPTPYRASTKHTARNQSEPYQPLGIDETDPDFNHAGHFSLDAIDASDSEDDENPVSPMDIDSVEPIVLNQTETILARQHIEPGYTQSYPKSDEQMPIALNKTEAILAEQPINRINSENRSPKLGPTTTAARRAVKLFPKDSTGSTARAVPLVEKNASQEMTPHEIPVLVTPVVERLRHKVAITSTSLDISIGQQTEKARYDNVLQFFPDDEGHSLPGLEEERLPANACKVEHLREEMLKRLHEEELESYNILLRQLGVRQANSPLITELSPNWMKRALDAPRNGHFSPRDVHPDAVELNPRDFGKLVPPTAWLNDDCVHSSLCCLAAYVNKQAGVRNNKFDAPKCVALSSLYWKAFCSDYNKLYPRPFSRKWSMRPDNFLQLDTVLIPVNSNAHWTLIVIRPSRRTVSYLDSFHNHNEAQLRHAYQWLQRFLGNKFVADDWSTQEFGAPRQTNAWDCGVFVITNAMCLALGINPMSYDEESMPIQRQRIAAMLLNGGFHGEFDLGHL
ncbi:hypothetical protein F5Y14DRAFT_444225 [Nemania sp. NC0429]|nr:hypothetical protein F5Y14DRAFT_444225 [Nemania sp. NC0429]